MSRNILLWIVALFITLASAVYQRMTGPTHPVRGKITVAEKTIKYKLPRAYVIGEPAAVIIPAHPQITATLSYRRHNSEDAWTAVAMENRDGQLKATLPELASGGKMQYYLEISDQQSTQRIPDISIIISRFRLPVPAVVLIPHVILMFLAILLSTRTGLEALKKNALLTSWTLWTLATIFVGGMIFGPLVQKYAFGVYWTGIPYGMDLTDNKTLVFLLVWLIAAFNIRKNAKARAWVIAAALVTLIAFAIPHSTFGTELNYMQPPQP